MATIISRDISRKLARERRSSEKERVVGIDQSLSNCALVLFEDGTPIDRCVFHTGDPTTKKHKEKVKRGDIIFGEYFESYESQVDYLIDCILYKITQWNPHFICLEGLAFNATGKTERQLAGLYFSTFVTLSRELGYTIEEQIFKVTPHQAKKLARETLPEDQQYLNEYTSRGKRKLNPMKKPDMVKALKCTKDAWLLDGYTRSTLVASRTTPTGLEDLPDAYFIGKFFLENKSTFIKN